MLFKVFVFILYFLNSTYYIYGFTLKTNFINKNSFLSMKKDKTKQLYTFYKPKNSNQEKYQNLLNNDSNNIIIAVGPAGTGKTMFACLKAIQLLKSGDINKIIITRPVVTVEEDIGFLPGNVLKKMDPWTRPIFDLFLEYYSKTELDCLLYSNVIEVCPLAFMRGRTFKNSFIIADEMQNSSPNQMKMLTTRIGINTRMVITGDLMQSDIIKNNGLNDIISKIRIFEKYNCFYNNTSLINIVDFDSTDIERSDIVKNIIYIYDFKLNNVNKINEKTSRKNTNTIVDNIITNITNNTNNTNETSNKLFKTSIKIIDDKTNSDAALIPKHHI